MLVLTDHNKFRWFIETKSLSSRQVRWAQKLSHYHFQINYRQSKTNEAVDALFQYPQRSDEEEDAFQAENIKIVYFLQFSLTNASLSGLTLSEPSSLHQILVCRTHVLSKLCQFWNSLQSNIARDSPFIANIRGMRLQLSKLQENDKEAKLLRGFAGFLKD